MHWYIAAPFSKDANDQWLGKYVPGKRHSFSSIPAVRFHDRSRSHTSTSGWLDYFVQGWQAWCQTRRAGEAGIITCFPQLPVTIGAFKSILDKEKPLVAWAFNLGNTPAGLRQRISKYTLSRVNQFVVHSTHEIGVYSRWLGLPEDRFTFVPLQRAIRAPVFSECNEQPYIIAMGSAKRDYRLLIDALRPLGYRTIIVAGAHAVAGLDIPAHVEVRSNLSIEACHELLQKARISVIPVANQATASGQVTLIDSMMFAKPTIITRCPGSVDYVDNERDGFLVPADDAMSMTLTIEGLWKDNNARVRIGQNARLRVEQRFSDEAVGRRMGNLLDQIAGTG